MKVKNRKPNKDRKDKITVGLFFRVHWKVIKELYVMDKSAATRIILLSLIGMGANFVELKLLEYSTNRVSAYIDGENADTFQKIMIHIGVFIIILLLFRIVSNLYDKISARYQSKVFFSIEKKIINKLSEIPYEYYESNSFHEKINLAGQASDQYSKGISGVTELAGIILMLVVYGFLLSKINPIFIGVIFLSVVVCFMIAGRVTDKQLECWRLYVSPEKRKSKYFGGIFGDRINHQNIQTEGTYSYFSDKYGYYNKRQRRSALKFSMLTITSELATSVLFMITFFITVLVVGKGVAEGTYQIGYYSMVIMLLSNLFMTIKQFAWTMMNNNWHIKVLDSYYEILSLDKKENLDNVSTGEAIEINGLQYKYSQAENCALNNINITYKKGEKIAVVGHNGSGKTTLISIILGLLKDYEGLFKHNNIICSAVMQDFGQYQMTVKENIEIGCGGLKLPEEKIVDILKQINMYDFISSKPDGIYTKLGQLEDGVELSK
jgi:ATP-binding cassette subfamily B protein